MDAAPSPELLPVRPAAAIDAEPQHSGWLIEGLWTRQGVGLIGGAPKCCKTWLALDLAVSVASGTPALSRFSVRERGPVLFYGAEDQAVHLRLRIEAIAAARGLGLIGLELGMAALLAELRILQRRYQLALVLVHHLRKQSGPADGQALRGSGDLHAWGDSNLFLRRRQQQLVLTAEHRTAPAPPPYVLELAGATPHLRVLDPESDIPEPTGELADRILAALARADRPLSRDALRQTLGIRNATLGEILARLRAERRIERHDGGFVLDR